MAAVDDPHTDAQAVSAELGKWLDRVVQAVDDLRAEIVRFEERRADA
jgi:hypothetical protein